MTSTDEERRFEVTEDGKLVEHEDQDVAFEEDLTFEGRSE